MTTKAKSLGIACLAIFCLVMVSGHAAFAGEVAPRVEVERQVIKFLASEDSQVFTFADPFHLVDTTGYDFTHWAGAVLRVHVMDGTEVSVLGGSIANVGQGTAGIGVLENLPPESQQQESDYFLAHAFHTGTGNAPASSGRTITPSHSAPVTLVFHAKNTASIQNSETDLVVQVYDIFHLTADGIGSTFLYPSDLVFGPSDFYPVPGEPFPSFPPATQDPGAHFIHVDFTTHIGPGQYGSHLYAKKTGELEIGIDHEINPVKQSTWSKLKEMFR